MEAPFFSGTNTATKPSHTSWPFPPWISLWIVFCVGLNCAGWLLSAAHQLNATGYAVIIGLGAAAFFFWQHKNRYPTFLPLSSKLRRRFSRPLPFAFAVIAVLAALGGLLYAPSNYDALAYRIPRVLNWLAEGQWYWIHTAFPRLNTRSCGFEWLMAPLLALSKSDRGCFLINFISFLLMPGLIFSLFTRLGVRRNVAWYWMWPLASGYCFSVQAGGIQNDLLGAPFALAMIDFALRARVSKRPTDLWLSFLAAGLLTGSKSSNLPLLLPWALAVMPCWRLVLGRPVCFFLVCIAAAFGSFLPNAILNVKYCGDWTGLAIESQPYGRNPAVRVALNLSIVAINNLMPPVFPFTRQWNTVVMERLPPEVRAAVTEHAGSLSVLRVPEMAVEEDAGLGLGLVVLLGVSLITIGPSRRRDQSKRPARNSMSPGVIALSSYLSALVLAAKAFVVGSGTRYFVPFFVPLIAPLLFFHGHAQLVWRRWWNYLAIAVMGLAAVPIILSPARPLWPAQTILSRLQFRGSPAAIRAATVYNTYAERPDCFAPLRPFFPTGTHAIGLITFDDPETSLWRPFGKIRVHHVLPGDSVQELEQKGVAFVVVGLDKFRQVFGVGRGFEEWLTEMHAHVIQRVPIRLRAGSLEAGEREWMIVQLHVPDLTRQRPGHE